MANENRKDFSAMLHGSKGTPKIKIITDTENIKKYGGSRMYFVPPINYDTLTRRAPFGGVTMVGELRDYFVRVSHMDFTEPITAGALASVMAWTGVQRRDDPALYWGTLKANRGSNTKYPRGVSTQKEKLGAEGHTVIYKGRKNICYSIKDYENTFFDLTQGEQAS